MDLVLKNEEKAVFALRKLFQSYGYVRYKMSKFEEYDFYVKNKDFLVSDNVITFTDTNGKLMALKPDVTLSIVKNGKDVPGSVEKVYYSENVYRVAGGSKSFKEITQTGLECVGETDDYCIAEVLFLALASLREISNRYVLDIAHLGILSGVLDETGVDADGRKKLLECVKGKNIFGAKALCSEQNVDAEKTAILTELMSFGGKPCEVLPRLKDLSRDKTWEKDVLILERVVSVLPQENVRIDFSVLNDMRYYNGIVFRGFVEGVPNGILSGGQYDLLLRKMGRKSGAIGFAVCPERLEELPSAEEYDADVVLLYDEKTPIGKIAKKAEECAANGESVRACKVVPDKFVCRKFVDLREGGNNA